MKMDGSAFGILIIFKNNDQEDRGEEMIIYCSHYFPPPLTKKYSEGNCQVFPEFTWNTWKNRRQGENKEGASVPSHRLMTGAQRYPQTFLLTSQPGNNVSYQKRNWWYSTLQACARCMLLSKSALQGRWSYTHYAEGTNGNPEHNLPRVTDQIPDGTGIWTQVWL